MRFELPLSLVLLLGVIGSSWGSPPTEDPAVDSPLKDKGLTKQGYVYVLDAEKPVLAKLKEARTSFATYASMSDQQLTTQQLAERGSQLEQTRSQIQNQMADLNQRIAEQRATTPLQSYGGFGRGTVSGTPFDSPLVAERNQLQGALAEITKEQNLIKSQTPQGKQDAALASKVKEAEDTFKATLGELRKQVDEVKKKYSELDADQAVKDALKEAKKGNSKNRLGPSDAFNTGAKELEKAEKQFFGKKSSAGSKKKTKSKK